VIELRSVRAQSGNVWAGPLPYLRRSPSSREVCGGRLMTVFWISANVTIQRHGSCLTNGLRISNAECIEDD
jgi:hypothetical protein